MKEPKVRRTLPTCIDRQCFCELVTTMIAVPNDRSGTGAASEGTGAGPSRPTTAEPQSARTERGHDWIVESPERPASTHVLTVSLEDYFQVDAFDHLVGGDRWHRFESRIGESLQRTLDLLARCDTHATFFVLGWTAERWPELVRRIADAGHEVADRGYLHRGLKEMRPETFRDDLRRSRAVIEEASGRPVLGYRLADGWIGEEDLWALDVLASEGYVYDSSLVPMLRTFRDEPWRRFVHRHEGPHGVLWELPPSTDRIVGCNVPIAGGNWFRQLPETYLRRAIRRWIRTQSAPFVMYFHTWELDDEQPRISGADTLTRVRHYRNLERMRPLVEDFLTAFRFGPAIEHLRSVTDARMLEEIPAARRARAEADGGSRPIVRIPSGRGLALAGRRPASEDEDVPAGPRLPVTIVVPCYNEERSLHYLANTLAEVERELSFRYDVRFVFVDDCSRDRTWDLLNELFAARPNCRVVQHEMNRGVSAAIRTGLVAADTEIVCSMDCDCTYDPYELVHMIPLLVEGADLVTASPYHPDGRVKNVPAWRLGLSKSSSWMYRRVLGLPLSTYTSCFRVYRRSAVLPLDLREGGFLGVAELLGELALSGGRIAEHPATLEVRIFGESKMKTGRTIAGHLRMLGRLLLERLRRSRNAATDQRPAPILPAHDAAGSVADSARPAPEPSPETCPR